MRSKIQITPEMKRQFRSETGTHLDQLEKLLMTIEREPEEAEAVHTAFRYVHSIKGNSDYLGIGDINGLAHILEDLMDDIRKGRIEPGPAVMEILFQGLDLLKEMNRKIEDPDYQERDLSSLQAAVAAIRVPNGAGGNASRTPEGRAPRDGQIAVSDVLEREIRVDIDKIDRFMEHLSEFAEAHNALQYLSEALSPEDLSPDALSSDAGGVRSRVQDLRAVSVTLKKVFDNFQTDLISIRLLKLDTLFDRLHRMVRDLSRRQGKLIDLKLSGGEVSVDRKIMARLVDPLVHLVRNAVDHGIEAPEVREKAGKPKTGTIDIHARQEGVHVVIDVADDGSGLDLSGIRQEAMTEGFADSEALSSMDDADLIRLVFRAGFTTRKEADTVSGRGVGLDVVKSAVTVIGGSVGFLSHEGPGVRVRLRVPISMTVTEVLLIRADQGVYAIPFSNIRRIFRIRPDRIRGFKETEMALYEGNLMTLRHLGDWLDPARGFRSLRGPAGADEIPVMAVGTESGVAGIAVDAVLRRESVVIRPLRRFMGDGRTFSGAAVLGDGRVVMVIDPAGTMDAAGVRNRIESGGKGSA